MKPVLNEWIRAQKTLKKSVTKLRLAPKDRKYYDQPDYNQTPITDNDRKQKTGQW